MLYRKCLALALGFLFISPTALAQDGPAVIRGLNVHLAHILDIAIRGANASVQDRSDIRSRPHLEVRYVMRPSSCPVRPQGLALTTVEDAPRTQRAHAIRRLSHVVFYDIQVFHCPAMQFPLQTITELLPLDGLLLESGILELRFNRTERPAAPGGRYQEMGESARCFRLEVDRSNYRVTDVTAAECPPSP